MTDTETAQPARRSRLVAYLLWTTIGLALIVSLCLGGFSLWFREAAIAALPQLDGEIRVAGLKEPVTVTRDRTGTSNIVTGQSGQIFSPYYLDQFPAWINGTTLPLPFSEDAVAASRAHELVLRPDPDGHANQAAHR